VAHSSVAVDLDETLDILGYFSSEISFNLVMLFDFISKPYHFVFSEILHPGILVNSRLLENLLAAASSYTEDIGKRNFQSFIPW